MSGLKMKVGKPWGEYYYVRWAGVDPRDGYNTWYDKNGNLTKSYSEEDAVFVGKQRYAPWSGGFGTQFGWKGISVSADFSFMLGQYMLNNERFFTENPTFAGSDNQTVDSGVTDYSCLLNHFGRKGVPDSQVFHAHK